VLLHGVGSNEQDLLSLAKNFDGRLAIYSLRAPLMLGPNSYAWFHLAQDPGGGRSHDPAEAEAARQDVVRFLQGLRKNPELDPSRVYLLGFSQGAMMSLSVALTEPELIRGAVIASGRTLPEIAARVRGRTFPKPPDILLLHGIQDARLPFSNALETEAVLQKSGFEPDFRSYDAGHEINLPMRAAIGTWLRDELPAR
jgi:phospholipase/carboxylesterase